MTGICLLDVTHLSSDSILPTYKYFQIMLKTQAL